MHGGIRGIIFDFDATLGIGELDKAGVNQEMFEVLRARGLTLDFPDYLATVTQELARLDRVRMDTGLEPTFAEYYGKALTSLGFQPNPALIEEWQRRIWNHHCFRLYPTAQETLEALASRNYRMAVVSNTINGTTRFNLERTGISSFFRIVIQSCDVGVRKPNRRIFELALADLEFRADECLAIGNSPYFDIMRPHEMGMTTVLMRTELSYREPRGLADGVLREPDFAIDRLEELLAVLEGLSRWT
jgi:FMN phosphatase YigB (HAD superfamily)